MPEIENIIEWRGHELLDREGEKIGRIEEIYLDEQTDKPEWALVTAGLFGTKSSFVPLANASAEGDEIRVAFDKAKVKDAPRMEVDQELSQQQEAELYSYYGFDYGESRSGSGQPEGQASGGGEASGDDAMTRSEEELRVGTAKREAGRARLRKYVVTEDVTKTVPVQREEVRVEREPVTEANVDKATSGPDISEGEHEVTLHEEEVVVEKRAVPKERVKLDKETVTEEQEVSEEVRKERIEAEGTKDA